MLPNLEKRYWTSMYLMDRKSGYIYITETEGYKQIEEKGLLYPSESMIIAGALEGDRVEHSPLITESKIQGTPTVESTRVPLKSSTERRDKVEYKEPLTHDQLLEIEKN